MRIWYQSYSAIGFDPRWTYYEEHLTRYVREVARPTTEVSVHGVPLMVDKMVNSRYLQYLHSRQIHENALEAERQGYDSFVLRSLRARGDAGPRLPRAAGASHDSSDLHRGDLVSRRVPSLAQLLGDRAQRRGVEGDRRES